MRKKRLFIVGIVSACLILPVAVSLGFVNLPIIPILNPGPPLGSFTPNLLCDPDTIIKDYLNDPSYQIGGTFSVDVNISAPVGEPDLYTWHVKISYDNDTLNVNSFAYGDFLAVGTVSPNGTSSGVADITGTFNDDGYAWIAESVLGDYAGVDGNGTLLTIEFLITGYGCSEIDITTTESMPTQLLDSAGSDITFTVVNGYFKNKLMGDANGDGMVTGADAGTLADHWTGPPPGLYPYSRCVDQIDDGMITGADAGVVADNWLRSLP